VIPTLLYVSVGLLPSKKFAVISLEPVVASVYAAVAVPKIVSLAASNNIPEKVQTNGGIP
jgi:hypothetical protein